MTRYLLAGGGTAGHVNPLLAVADRIRDRDPDATILVLGTKEGLESRLVPARGYELIVVERLPFPRSLGRAAFGFPGRFRALVAHIAEIIAEHRIDVVVGFGGYVSAPAYLAARRHKLPIVVHEANAKPGMANRLGSVLTRFVGVAFTGTKLPHARFVGMPLLREIEVLDRGALRAEAFASFGLDAHRPVLLVTGGSLGAQSINETVYAAAPAILGTGWQLLHIVGARSDIRESGLPGYHVMAFCDRMDYAFSVADLVVARAGSATVSELTALGLPAVYVPLAIGNGEQRRNARGIVDAGGALLVENRDFTPSWIDERLVPLLQRPEHIARLAAVTSQAGVRDGTDRTVALIEEAVR